MDIKVIYKQTKIEHDMTRLGLTYAELIDKYYGEKVNVDTIVRSHQSQIWARNATQSAFPHADFDPLGYFSEKVHDLVIVLGGDNSFTRVSQHVKQTPILGVNSDPTNSVGCLLRYSISSGDDAKALATKLYTHHYDIEEWPRLEGSVNGMPLVPATSEYFLGERQRQMMSRHILTFRGETMEQKSSGLIVATGAGSTGWINSAQSQYSLTTQYPPTERRAVFLVTEPYGSMELTYGNMRPEDELVVKSLNDDEGVISADACQWVPFGRGSEARIKLGTPLNVLVPHE